MSKVVGDHLLCDSDILVFKHVFGGTTYTVACQIQDGTNFVARLTESNANNVTVINAAFAGLTAARDWQEKVTVKGDYIVDDPLTPDSYTIWEIVGKIQLAANSDVHTVYAISETEIEVYGGHIDGNGGNQGAASNTDTMLFDTCTHINIHDMLLGGGHHDTDRGRTIELDDCEWCTVHDCRLYVYAAGYDHIVLINSACIHNVISNNICDGTDGLYSCAIQTGLDADRNLIIGNYVYSPGGGASGIKNHGCDYISIVDNFLDIGDGMEGIGLIDDSDYCLIQGNFIYNADAGIQIRGDNPVANFNTIQGNYIYLSTAAGATGVDLTNDPDNTEIFDNHIHGQAGTSVGIHITAGCTNTWLRDNKLHNLATNITDAGTNTRTASGLVIMGGSTGNLTAASPRYLGLFGRSSDNAVENDVVDVVGRQGMLKNFRVRLSGAPGAGNSYVFRVRINGANSGIAVTIADAATTGSDLVNEAEIVIGDRVDVRVERVVAPAQEYVAWSIEHAIY